MNKTILSIAVGVVFFLAVSNSYADVCTISENNLNGYRKNSQELVTISNDTNQCKFNSIDYYVRDTYRTRNLNIRSEIRRIRVDGKEEERRIRYRVNDIRNRMTRSESLPDIGRERIRNAREGDINFRRTDRRTLERNDMRFVVNRVEERTFRREVRDNRFERQTRTDDTDAKQRMGYTRLQNSMVSINDKHVSTSWPFSNFVQSAIGVVGLYYFGMYNKSTK